MKAFIFLGAPGAGKGTAAARIAEKTNARHVSTGAMLRGILENGASRDPAVKSRMNKGELVPDSMLIDMIGELFKSADSDATLIFDGFPRTVPQAEALEKLAAEHSVEIVKAVSIEVPEEIILKRLGGRQVCPACGAVFHVKTLPSKKEGICDTCGAALVVRNDDTPEAIKNRLVVHAEKTAPLVGWYEKAGKLARADGSGSADDAVEKIMAVM